MRVVASNNGRDQSAFLIGCRDVLASGGYDLVVKLHSKKTPQDAANAGRNFKRQQFENLLLSADYAAGVVALFQQEPGLGLAYPPMVHIGYGTMGHAWWANKPAFVEMTSRLGIRVPVDDTSPLAPYGSMYFARPEALRLLAEHDWTYDEFGGADAYLDGGLAHVLERMPSYAAGELGFHTRTISNADYLASSYTALDYNLDQMSTTMPETTMHHIDFLRRLGPSAAAVSRTSPTSSRASADQSWSQGWRPSSDVCGASRGGCVAYEAVGDRVGERRSNAPIRWASMSDSNVAIAEQRFAHLANLPLHTVGSVAGFAPRGIWRSDPRCDGPAQHARATREARPQGAL